MPENKIHDTAQGPNQSTVFSKVPFINFSLRTCLFLSPLFVLFFLRQESRAYFSFYSIILVSSCFIAIIADSRRRMDKSLTTLQNKCLLQENTTVAVTIDDDGRILTSSPNIFHILGYLPDALTGKSIDYLIISADDHQRPSGPVQQEPGLSSWPGGKIFTARHSDGGLIPMYLSSQYIHQGEKRLRILLLAEASELVQTRAQIRNLKADLEQIAFISSHDLMEPARMISNFADLLMEKLGNSLDGECREYLDYLVSYSYKMRSLVGALRQYTSIDSSGCIDKVNMNDVLLEVRKKLCAEIEQSGAKIHAEKLPVIIGSRAHQTLILFQLVSNAIKFRSNFSPEIRISVRESKHEWEISVSDNGQGISSDYQEQVFMIFKKMDKSTPGEGIGLSICKKIIQEAGGRIWFISVPGYGSDFRFTVKKAGICQSLTTPDSSF